MKHYLAHAGESHATEAEAKAHEVATSKAQLEIPQKTDGGIINSGFLLAAIVVLLIGGSLAAYFTFTNRK